MIIIPLIRLISKWFKNRRAAREQRPADRSQR